MKQLLLGGTNPSILTDDTNPTYSPLSGHRQASATLYKEIIPTNGTISRLSVKLSGAPGAGKSWAFTLYVNDLPTALTCTISGASDTSGSDYGHAISVVAGDTVYIKNTPSGTPARPQTRFSVRFESSTAGEGIVLFCGLCNTGANRYNGICGVQDADATESLTYTTIPFAGTAKKLYIGLSTNPGADPAAYAFTLRLNGGNTALTFSIVGAATTGNDTANTAAIAAGNYMNLKVAPVSGPANAPIVYGGFVIAPTTDGDFMVSVLTNANLFNSGARYQKMTGSQSNGWVADETTMYSLSQYCRWGRLYVNIIGGTSPGGGKTWDFTVRRNAGDTGITCSITGAATTGSDTTHEQVFGDGDNIDIGCVPTNSPSYLGSQACISLAGRLLEEGGPMSSNVPKLVTWGAV